jgi:hypothetical protein
MIMPRRPILLFSALFSVVLSLLPDVAIAQPVAPELPVARFSAGDLTGWKDQVVYGTQHSTVYSFVQDNGKNALMGKCVDGASGLIRKIEIDPKVYPVISWSWKIDHTVRKGNERVKAGHDFSARLYVVFPRGLFSSTRAIEYVWGNVMHKGESLRNPYSNNMVMIAVDAGNELAGHWTFHKRNYAEDYRAAFGEEAPKVGAIAIMTDSDNTHESAVGYYGDITVLQAAREEGQKPKEPKQKEPQQKELKPKEPALKDQPHKELQPKEPPLKDQLHKELQPREQPIKEPLKKEPKPKELLKKEQPNGNGHSVPPPAAPSLPPAATNNP